MSKGDSVIFGYAVNGHNSLNTSTLQSEIDTIKPQWDAGVLSYENCLKASEGNQNGLSPIAKTVANIEASRTNRNAWQTITWDLENDVADDKKGIYPITMTIEVRYSMVGTTVQGYDYRNPRFALKRTGQNFRVRGLGVTLNNEAINSVTTYNAINRVVSSTTPINFAENWAAAFAYFPNASASDQHQIQIVRLDLTSDVDVGEGGGGDGEFQIPAVVTWTNLTSTDLNLGVFQRYCVSCHNNNSAARGINLQNYDNSFANRSVIVDSIYGRNGRAQMPPGASAITTTDKQVIEKWVSSGATQ